MGSIWFETKKSLEGSDWDKYDGEFFLAEYKSVKEGKKSKEDVIKEVLQRVRNHEPDKGTTIEQFYMKQFKSFK